MQDNFTFMLLPVTLFVFGLPVSVIKWLCALVKLDIFDMDADSMKSYHLEQAKSAFGKAIETSKEKMCDDSLQNIKDYLEEHGEQAFNTWIQEMLKEGAEKWQQL